MPTGQFTRHPVDELAHPSHLVGADVGKAHLELSMQRAEAICDYLINAGISESRLSYEGKGSTDPIYPNDTENARSHNRRVEMKLTRMEK